MEGFFFGSEFANCHMMSSYLIMVGEAIDEEDTKEVSQTVNRNERRIIA